MDVEAEIGQGEKMKLDLIGDRLVTGDRAAKPPEKIRFLCPCRGRVRVADAEGG